MRLRKIYIGVGIFLLVILGATVGFQFAGMTFVNALYTVVILVFGVGYGDVFPMSPRLKLYTILVIVAGTSSVVYIVGGFIRLVTEGEIQRTLGTMKKNKTIDEMHGHAIICGYGRIGQILARELTESDFPFVVVDRDPERVALAELADCLCIRGSATEEEVLLKAHIERATVLATVLPDDALNVFITLTARNLNQKIRIVARGEEPSTEKKLRQAGADEVVLPAAIGGMRIANSITRPSIMEFLSDAKGLVGHDLKYLGLEVDELTVKHDASLEGMTVGAIQRKVKGDLLVLAVKIADGRILKSNFTEHSMTEGDTIVVIGKGSCIAAAFGKYATARTELI